MKFSAKAVNDSFKRLNEAINKDNISNKRLTEARMNYAQAKEEFCDLFFNQNKDPFYEEDGSGDYIMNLMWKVESKNGIEVETSIQGGAGSLDIYKDNHLEAQRVDYDDYLERVAELVQESKTPKAFMNSWLSQLESLMDDDRYLPDIEDEEDYEDEEDHKVDSPADAFYDKEGNLLDKNGKSIKNRSSIKKITIADNVTSISAEAFHECYSLTSIKIPDSVTSIGDYAFWVCERLTSINIPNSVTNIGIGAFRNCRSLTSIKIPNGVTSIEEEMFFDCESLTSVNIPNSVTSIRKYAFSKCYNLTSVNIPEGVTDIGRHAFYECRSLTSIDIPNSVTSIGDEAFMYCYNLTSINIPNSVTSIPYYAFGYCHNLTNVTIPNSVTSIGDLAFNGCNSLTSIDIPDSVTSIGEASFVSCPSLKSIKIPSSVTSIGNRAFLRCSNLKTVYLENPNTKYEDDTFPEDTKIIKKGTNESMRIKTKESINLKRAKRLLENNGYEVVKKNNLNKESTFKTINDSFKRLREDSLDDVGTFRITVKDAETKYADKPFKMEGIEYTPSRVKGTKNYYLIYGHEFGQYFDDDEVFTILARPGDIYEIIDRRKY